MGLFCPATPRLNEPMSRRKRAKYWLGTGLSTNGGGVRSVKISAAAGGEMKSFVLMVHLPPLWHVAQPASAKSSRPSSTSSAEVTFGPLGVRMARRTHSLSAVKAGTWVWLPGRVTVTCWRFALGSANALSTQGPVLMSPVSLMSRPWFGSRTPVLAPALHGIGAARAPGPDTLRMFASKSSTSSKTAE